MCFYNSGLETFFSFLALLNTIKSSYWHDLFNHFVYSLFVLKDK